MDSKFVPEPIFKVKPDLDPFEVYGHSKLVEQFPGVPAAILDKALKEAREQAKDRFQVLRRQVLDSEDSDDEQSIVVKRPSSKQKKTFDVKTISDKPTEVAEPVRGQRIEKTLEQIHAVFTKIFEALLVLLQNPQVRASPNEIERMNRRSKEFDIRISRMIYEWKQKIVVLKATLIKLGLHDTDATLHEQAQEKLIAALRMGLNILQAYSKHLPLSDGRVFPEALPTILEHLTFVAQAGKDLGHEGASQMEVDVRRLQNVTGKFKTSQPIEKQTARKERVQKKKPEVKEPDIKLINKLAKKKFGSPLRRQKVIHPRPNKVLLDRAAASKAKLDHQHAITPIPRFEPIHERHAEPNIVPHKRKVVLDIANDELVHILEHKKDFERSLGRRGELFDYGRAANPMEIVARVSDRITGDLIRAVCQELISDDLIAKMLEMELK